MTGIGIPTEFKGIVFRSRLEARWAHFFDSLNWKWEYEPLDLQGYIPDFLIYGARSFLVEVKPIICLTDWDEYQLEVDVKVGDWRPSMDILLVGSSPLDPFIVGGGGIGMLRERGDWACAPWHLCYECGEASFHHMTQSYEGRPCGHYDGDQLIHEPPLYAIKSYWNRACNATQWRKP